MMHVGVCMRIFKLMHSKLVMHRSLMQMNDPLCQKVPHLLFNYPINVIFMVKLPFIPVTYLIVIFRFLDFFHYKLQKHFLDSIVAEFQSFTLKQFASEFSSLFTFSIPVWFMLIIAFSELSIYLALFRLVSFIIQWCLCKK